jgi:hypothetical protein
MTTHSPYLELVLTQRGFRSPRAAEHNNSAKSLYVELTLDTMHTEFYDENGNFEFERDITK